MAVTFAQREHSAATSHHNGRDVEEEQDIPVHQQYGSHENVHDELARLLPDSWASFSPAGYPAGSSRSDIDDESFQQEAGHYENGIHHQQAARGDDSDLHAPITPDLALPRSMTDSRSASPQARHSNALKRKRTDSPTNQQSLVPHRPDPSDEQQLQPIQKLQTTNAPATKALPHIGKVRLEQRTSKGRTRTIERPALPLWLARTLCKPEQDAGEDDEDVQRANEVLETASSLLVYLLVYFVLVGMKLMVRVSSDYREALPGRIGNLRKELGQAKGNVTAELRRAQAEEAIFKHALQAISVCLRFNRCLLPGLLLTGTLTADGAESTRGRARPMIFSCCGFLSSLLLLEFHLQAIIHSCLLWFHIYFLLCR